MRTCPSIIENHFTVVLGNNGTGKSRLLSTITRYFINTYDTGVGRSLFNDGLVYNVEPERIIAITSSLADRFPNDSTFSSSMNSKSSNKTKYSKRYVYLGTRNNANVFSHKALMTRALNILFDNLSNYRILKRYGYLFNYLGYRPVIKVNYKLSNFYNKFGKEEINEQDFLSYIKEKISKESYRNSFYKTFEHSRKEMIPSICAMINKLMGLSNSEYQLLINFSDPSIERPDYYVNNSETADDFKILTILSKLELVKNNHIQVYKLDNSEFDFYSASSGEASILSTLIALIPVICDGCLVLIDEPEISLHPSWQYRYVELLLKIFEDVHGCHIIIASHSHFIVSDLPVKNSTVITLVNDKGVVGSEMIKESTFGWSVEDILLNVFKLPTVRNYYLSQIISNALEMLADHDRSSLELEALKSEIATYAPLMKDSDPLKDIIRSILAFKA